MHVVKADGFRTLQQQAQEAQPSGKVIHQTDLFIGHAKDEKVFEAALAVRHAECGITSIDQPRCNFGQTPQDSLDTEVSSDGAHGLTKCVDLRKRGIRRYRSHGILRGMWDWFQ